MSSAELAAKIVKDLDPEDYKLLKVFASSLKEHEFLGRNQLAFFSKEHQDIIDFRLSKLHRMNLIMKRNNRFGLAMAGLDAIALKMLADRNIVEAMGKSIGVGKESDVFEAMTPFNEKRAIKLYRIGRISFRDIQRKRNWQFLSKKDSKSPQQRHRHWLMINIEAAKREYDALHRLKDIGARIPIGYYRAMHCVVLNRIDGRRLVTFKAKELTDPEYTLSQILKDLRLVYDHGMINADLSEFNVLVDSAENPWIIDWPQTVSTIHPNSSYLLRRDINNIVRFFNRRFKCNKKDDEAIRTVIDPG